MSAAHKHIRHGIGSVRPYLYGDLKLPELVKHAFGAQELERLPVGNGFDIYVEGGEAAYRRAL